MLQFIENVIIIINRMNVLTINFTHINQHLKYKNVHLHSQPPQLSKNNLIFKYCQTNY